MGLGQGVGAGNMRSSVAGETRVTLRDARGLGLHCWGRGGGAGGSAWHTHLDL